MAHQGFCDLKSAPDLYKKLERDYHRIVKDEADPYCAFDFLVTAYHMIDWIYPNDKNRQREFEQKQVLLQLCSHIANGAKHFEATASKHKSVSSLGKQAVWNASSVTERGWEASSVTYRLQIELDGVAKERFGASMTVRALADELLVFWSEKLGLE
ncbi:MAG: hypothetical protein CL583_18930 [Alteromonadaceae bacterium]|nr:hypothetical protein [Alteromonadaceae bacterium]|tara:strand:- start:1347 stop:1814 length:468 start_codon:yes stop_codon:yes gene_type:complete